jgi:APA family basic amino acid/polyamine antiporter
MKALFSTKSIDAILRDSEAPERSLRRTLGPVQITMLGIGAIIGAGIFATIGTAAAGDAARPGAGPALMLSFVLTAVACAFTAFCYAEFASMVPISGSAYTYAYATLGEVVAWIIGWDLIIEYAVGNVAVAISWANYFKTLVEPLFRIPPWLCTDFITAHRIPGLLENAPHLLGVPIVVNLVAFGIVALITVVLVVGIRESSWFNVGLVAFKLLVLGFFILVGWRYATTDHWVPFAPNGWAGIGAGAAVIFFAYIGFDAVSTAAEEARNPRRDLPIGIIGSLVVCTVVYIAVAAVFTGIIPYPALRQTLSTQQAEPLTLAFQYADIGAHKGLFVFIIALGSVIAHTAVLLVFQLGQPRIFFSMARDGLLPRAFASVHKRFRTPHVTTILTGLGVGVASIFSSLDEMVDLTNIGTLFAFILVCIGIVVLRVKDPRRKRPFRAPFGLLFPVLGVLSCLGLIYYLPPASWLRFAAWLNIGIVIYVCYGSTHSRLTGLHQAADAGAHAVRTAHAGAILAWGGTAALFLTRLADGLRQGAPLGEWFSTHLWWMTVPLLMNVFLLCPIALRRLRKAAAGDLDPADAARARAAAWMYGLLAAGTAATLLPVLA